MQEPTGIWPILTSVFNTADRNNLGLISAGIAFFALLSMFPTLAALVMIWSFFATPPNLAKCWLYWVK